MAKRKTKTRSLYITTEPKWKELKLLTDPAEQEKAFKSCEYFVRTEINKAKYMPVVKKWIKDHSGWPADETKIILANPDWAFSGSSISIYIHHKLGYMPEAVRCHYEKRKEEWLSRGRKVVAEKKEAVAEKNLKPVISIQERMKMQVEELCATWEHNMDKLVDGDFNIKSFDPYHEMIIYRPEIKGPHAKIIKDDFEPAYNEALEVKAWNDPDIKEGYGHFTAKMRKDFVELFEKINTACDTIIATKANTRRARKPKARSKDVIVKKMKFQVNCSELGIASIPATEIVYANELWLYNTKTRKIGVYHASNKDPRNMARPGAGLMVKGTTIQDFDEKLSMQKTLRKPKEQISNWTGSAKTKFAKSFNELTTTGIKMNGRINDNTIILQVF